MGLIRRVVRRVVRFGRRVVKGALNIGKGILKSGLSMATGFMGMASKLLDKVPFGGAIKGMLGALASNPLALMAAGPLGALAAMAFRSGNTQNLSQMAQYTSQSPAYQYPPARNNVMQITAYAQARIQFSQVYSAQYRGF